jgi:hypothetical protein
MQDVVEGCLFILMVISIKVDGKMIDHMVEANIQLLGIPPPPLFYLLLFPFSSHFLFHLFMSFTFSCHLHFHVIYIFMSFTFSCHLHFRVIYLICKQWRYLYWTLGYWYDRW